MRCSNFGGQSLHVWYSAQRFQSTNAESDSCSDQPSHKSKLVQLGFTEEGADRVLLFYASQKLNINITNVHAWVELLHTYNVDDAPQVVSDHPIILTSRAATAKANAAGVVEWLNGLRATPEMVTVLFSKRPTLLTVPHATAAAVTECLRSKLSWSDSTIVNVLTSFPKVYGVSPKKLDVRLNWLLAKGFSLGNISKMARSQPQLLLCNFTSPISSSRIRFMTTVMKQELLICLQFVTYSLVDRIGPRWAFHSLYCKDQPFSLNYRIRCSAAFFLKRLISPSLDAECASRGLNRSQVYEAFKISWKQGEGNEWDLGDRKKTQTRERRPAVLKNEKSEEGPEALN